TQREGRAAVGGQERQHGRQVVDALLRDQRRDGGALVVDACKFHGLLSWLRHDVWPRYDRRMAPRVKSAQRVVEVFEYFAQRRAPATLTQICSTLDYPPSSTFVLLQTLRELGYLDYSIDERTFVPTVRAALLGLWVNDALLQDGTIVR